MTIPLDELAGPADAVPPDFKRDQWGRPSILQPDGKRKGYTRCSSAAKTIEDTFNLEKWARRNIAYGMAYDPSLVARVIAIGGEPSTWKKPEKDQVNTILEAADAVAKAHKSADIGTAVHHLTHRVDRGEQVNGGPYQADLDAYRQALLERGLIPHADYTECRIVNDLLQMAGTADRILKDGDLYRIADIKTGASIEYGGLGWAAQLAAYAGGVLYDPQSDERIAPPPIDTTVGYIIHLPAGQGRCDIYEVDLVAGHRAAELANEIRAIRKASKTWIVPAKVSSAESVNREAPSPLSSNSSDGPASSAEDWRFEAKRRYDLLNHDQQVDYTTRKQTIDTSNLAAVFALLDEVDPIQTVSVPAPEPVIQPSAPVHPLKPPDEGGPVSQADVDALKARFNALPLDGNLWTGTLVAQGNKTHSFRIKDAPTVRRYEIYRGILTLAEWLFSGKGDAA